MDGVMTQIFDYINYGKITWWRKERCNCCQDKRDQGWILWDLLTWIQRFTTNWEEKNYEKGSLEWTYDCFLRIKNYIWSWPLESGNLKRSSNISNNHGKCLESDWLSNIRRSILLILILDPCLKTRRLWSWDVQVSKINELNIWSIE